MILITNSKTLKTEVVKMNKIIDLLGKSVKFVHTENDHFFEEQGQITEIVLSLSGEHQISINNDEFYILSNLLEFEII
jgi:hypothetical protein